MRMIRLDGHLHAHHIKPLEHAIVHRHMKRRHAVAVRPRVGKVENRQLAGIRHIADAALGDVVTMALGLLVAVKFELSR